MLQMYYCLHKQFNPVKKVRLVKDYANMDFEVAIGFGKLAVDMRLTEAKSLDPKKVMESLRVLTEQEARFITKHYGRVDGNCICLFQLNTEDVRTIERIRLIIKKGVSKLKHRIF